MTTIHVTHIFPYQAEMRGDKGELLAVLDLRERLRYEWKGGGLIGVRYKIGSLWEKLFGYDPEGTSWQYRFARFIGLSGY